MPNPIVVARQIPKPMVAAIRAALAEDVPLQDIVTRSGVPGWKVEALRPAPRFPFAPVLEMFPDTRAVLARRLRMDPSTINKYVERGLSVWQADRLAVRLGFHPSALWPDWYECWSETAA